MSTEVDGYLVKERNHFSWIALFLTRILAKLPKTAVPCKLTEINNVNKSGWLLNQKEGLFFLSNDYRPT